jgi:hypothetical protein
VVTRLDAVPFQSECAKLRRQKELELEVTTGTIRDWEGDGIASLGDVLHMGSVAVGSEHKDRYLVLFPSHLLILSVSSRMSAFIYEVSGASSMLLKISEQYLEVVIKIECRHNIKS